MDNGLKLYSYRYKGDDRMFVGVLAHDLLKDAVSKDKSGFYVVDYGALGVRLFGSDAMLDASQKALDRAS